MLETSTVRCSGRQSGQNFAFELNVWLPVGRPEYDFSSVVDWMLYESAIAQGRSRFLIAFSRV
jgi:hypothetical protein